MSSRLTRRSQSSPSLSSIESLLLAQATWEYGAAPANWSLIAKLLSKHPLLSRPKSFFTPQSCHSMYDGLLKEAGLQPNESNYVPHAETNLDLARRYYLLRFEELRELIMAEESKFKAVLRDIEDIRAGLWDTRIQSRTTGQSPINQKVSDEVPSSKRARVQDGNNNLEPVDDASASQSRVLSKDVKIDTEGRKPRRTRTGDASRKHHEAMVIEDVGVDEIEASRQKNAEASELNDQRQEEEEEEIQIEEESKEEEEETSQGHPEAENEDEMTVSPKSPRASMETDSEQLADLAIDEKQSSDLEEPVVNARRSSRRHKSSAVQAVPHPPARARLRARTRVPESELQVAESDNDEIKDNIPTVDDERTSSPFESSTVRRRDSKRKASYVDSVDYSQDKKRPREDSEPADEEPGPSTHNTRARTTRNAMKTEEQVALKRFQNVIGMLHSQISQHRNGNIFHNPIKPSEAPDYHDIVKRPMDLKSIKTRVKDGVIGNSLEFQRDIYLMFANAMMYNRPGSDVYAMAEDMMLESEDQINAFRQTELGLVKRGQR